MAAVKVADSPVQAPLPQNVSLTTAEVAPAPTPMLDAAMARLDALKQHEHESPNATESSKEAKIEPPGAALPSVPVPKNPQTPQCSKPATSASSPVEKSNKAQASAEPDAAPLPPLSAVATAKDEPKSPAESEPRKDPGSAQPVAGEAATPLEITELRLCRKVLGFGSFEPVDDHALKAGQRLLLYWELAGLEYEWKDDAFHSRFSSRLEIRAADNDSIQWQQDLGIAEDVCRRRRRDCYVNYRLDLPDSFLPGPYRLRLIQTDQLSQRGTSAEIPFTIVR
jgi:hypothetical protein